MADPLGDSIASLCGALRGLREQVQSLATVHDAIDEFNSVFGSFQNAMALHASCLQFPSPPKPSFAAPPPRPTGIPKPQIAAAATTDPRGPSPTSGRGRDASNGAASKQHSTAPTGDMKTKKRPSSSPIGATSNKRTAASGSKNKQPAANKKSTAARARGAAAAAAAAAQKNTRPETAPWKWDKNIRDNIPRKYQSEAELAKLENILVYLKNRPGGVTIADLVKHSTLAAIRCKEILQTLTKLNLISRRQESVGFVYTFGSDS